MTPEALSASALQLYLTCSLKYRFQYVDRLPRLAPTANQAFGTAIHAALDWLHKEQKRGRTSSPAEVLQVFEADWYAQTQTGADVRMDDDPSLLAHKGKELLTQYYHLPRAKARDSELYFTLPLVNPATGDVLDVPIRGVIDLIEEDGAVVEFKAPQKAPPMSDLPDNLQLTVYSYAYEKLYGQPPKELRKVALVRTKHPRIETQLTGRDQKDYARLWHIASEVLRAVRADIFLPNRGCWMCGDCEYQADCFEWAGNEEVMADVQAAGK